MTRCAAIVALAVLTVTGCSGGGTTTPAPPPPDFGCPSKSIVDPQAKLISPAPGATGVSPAIGSITLAYGYWNLVFNGIQLVPSDGSTPVWAGTNPPPTLNTPGSGVVTFPIPALKARMTYTAYGSSENMAHLVCYTQITANFGTFTTQ